MGVPAFFRWLTRKYPSVIVHCIEEKPKNIDGTVVPEDTSKPNPNGVEFDNLYLDMNGIIHPCTHPEDKPAPKNEEEMMLAIFECIDRLFRIVRPRKLLYMAIDGVAPRAKMNQQRSRRFRASKETNEKLIEIERIREELAAKGCDLPPPKPKETHFDSNCITPGTPFMDRLSKCLHFYIHDRLNNDPGWKGIKVILSDANVPGEGEHKIMDYIRRQRALPGHDPNTAHCLCGADADLIMLGLATHEPNFTIIREEFRPNKPRPCEICGQVGHDMKDCLGLEKEAPVDADGNFVVTQDFSAEVEFIFVRINVLREYLAKELQIPNLPFPFDLERAIDDWVLMCFFVGNDFLPHLPSLEIREGAIDRLVKLYKDTVYKSGGYLTESGFVTLSRVQLILSELGLVEDEIFRNRQQNELRFKERMKNDEKRKRLATNCYDKPAFTPRGQFAPVPIGNLPMPGRDTRHEARNMRVQGMHTTTDGALARSNRDAASAMKAMLIQGKDLSSPDLNSSINSTGSNSSFGSPSASDTSLKRKHDDSDEEDNDEVRLWEAGFKDRYYDSKFRAAPNNYEFRAEVARQYVLGICWVLQYYYQGCASWEWYFPYHYAPFASDFVNIADVNTDFPKGTKPFQPLEQLMSVFPAASRSHVPEPWGRLMYDPASPIIDFYPEDFSVDLNGKKFAWQGVALLPFVDEKRLKATLVNYYDKLTDDEIRRNVRGDDRLYMRRENQGYDFLIGLYENQVTPAGPVDLDPSLTQGMSGTVLLSDDATPYKGSLRAPLRDLLDIEYNEVVCVRFRDPKFEPGFIFPAKRHAEAVDPPQVLKPGDLSERDSRNWRPMIGMTHSRQRAGLDTSGHRQLNHFIHGQGRGGGGEHYNNATPPMNSYGSRQTYDRNDNFRGSRGGGQGGRSNPWNRGGSNYGESHSGLGYRAADGHSGSGGGRYDTGGRYQQSHGYQSSSYSQSTSYSSWGYGGGYSSGRGSSSSYLRNDGNGRGGGGSGSSSSSWGDGNNQNYQNRGNRDGRGGSGSSSSHQQQRGYGNDYNARYR